MKTGTTVQWKWNPRTSVLLWLCLAACNGPNDVGPSSAATPNIRTSAQISTDPTPSVDSTTPKTSPTSTSKLPTSTLPADLVLMNYAGDCNELAARFFSPSKRIFYGFIDTNICAKSKYGGPEGIYLKLITLAKAGSITLDELSQSSSYALIPNDGIGDCRVYNLSVNDPYVGNQLSYIIDSPCTNTDLSVPASTVMNVLTYYVKEGVDPLLAMDVVSRAITQCDVFVDPFNYQTVIGALKYDSNKWTVVCFKPGTYYGPLRITNAEHLILQSQQVGAAHIYVDLPLYNDYRPSAALEIYSSKNVVVDGIDLTNRHYFTSPGPDNTANWEASHALFVLYSEGILWTRSNTNSNGKVPASFAYDNLVRIKDVSISGSYFALDISATTVFGDGINLTQNLAGDQHSMIWVWNERVILNRLNVYRYSGKSLLSGFADGTKHVTYVKDLSFWPNFDSYVQQNQNYGGIQLILRGYYPTDVPDYWWNPYGPGGNSVGTAVWRQ